MHTYRHPHRNNFKEPGALTAGWRAPGLIKISTLHIYSSIKSHITSHLLANILMAVVLANYSQRTYS